MDNSKYQELFKIQNSESLLKFYRTPTSFTSESLNPSVTVIKENPFLLVPNSTSFSIFNLQDLKLQFIGHSFSSISAIAQCGAFIYVATENRVNKTLRGEIIAEFEIENVIEMIKFGSFLILNIGMELVVIECIDEGISVQNDFISVETLKEKSDVLPFKELYRLPFNLKIKTILHPNTYINKILIIFENGSSELFNLSSKKSIFKYEFGTISCVTAIDILDVIALGMMDGSIKIFNLKKNKQILEITDFVGNPIRHMTFKGKFATISSESVSIYNLELKKEVYIRSRAYFGLILNDSTALITTKSSVEIINLEDFTILKSRKVLNENIKSIKSYSKTELLFNSEDQIFKMNVYRDEINRFLKTRASIDKISLDLSDKSRTSSLMNSELDINSLFNPNILLYGEDKVSYIDRELKWHNFIHLKCKFISVFKDFCLLSSANSVLVMNLKSKRVICTLKHESNDNVSVNALSGILENDSFTLLTTNSIQSYDFNCKMIFNYKLEQNLTKGTLEKHENMFFISNQDSNLTVISLDSTPAISRTFDVDQYAVSSRVLVGISNNLIKIFDIPTGSLIDTIETNKCLKSIALLDDFKFVAILDSNSSVHILSNQSHFNSIVNMKASGTSKSQIKIPVIKKESNFYKDLVIYKNFNSSTNDLETLIKTMSKDEIKQMLEMIKANIKTEFFESQKILSKILLYKSKMIESEDIKEIYSEVEVKLKEIEENVLTSIGYLNLNKNKLI